jgi:peroxiredoxin
MKRALQISALMGLLALAACGDPGQDSPGGGGTATGGAHTALTLYPLDPPSGPGAMAPRFSTYQDEIFLTWLQAGTGSPETDALLFSRLEGQGTAARWTRPVEIVRGENFFANWADNPGSRRGENGTLVAYWLARSGPDTYAYDVRLARSVDQGRTWGTAGVLHHDGVKSEHGFVSSVSDPSGMRAFWLDGREMTMEGHGGHEGSGNMTLRTTVVGEKAGMDQILDDRVCECCQTAAGMTTSGPVVVYRDRSADETRDIWIVRQTDSGWSEPRPVHVDGWRVPGCPVNGPSLAVRPGHEDELVVAWFTAAGTQPRIQAAFSRDGGASFDPPVLLDDAGPLGRVDVVWDGKGGVVVLWLSPRDQEGAAELLLRRVASDGTTGPTYQVATTSTARSSGFPRLVRRGEALYLVWTLPEGESTRLKAAALPLSSLPGWAAPAAADDGGERPWDGKNGSKAPEYSALTLDGERVHLADLRGRPVLVNFWATWCMPCRQETPALIGIHERYAPDGLQVLGVSVDTAGDQERVRSFLAREGVPYRTLLDPEDKAAQAFGLPMLPGSFLFNRDGILVWSRLGVVAPDDTELATALDSLRMSGPSTL